MLNNFTQVLWRLNETKKITDAQRDAAIKATTELLVAIDIKRVDELRRKFELPPECLAFAAEIYTAILASPYGELREALPLSTGVSVLPTQTASIKGTSKVPFHPERLFISNACTEGGAADWIVNDILLDGKTVLLQPGDLPGDMFESRAIDSFVSWGECQKTMEIVVTYIGLNNTGCPLFCSVMGSRLAPSPKESELQKESKVTILKG